VTQDDERFQFSVMSKYTVFFSPLGSSIFTTS
jgi:hypothetical protein